ncbi:MAG: putative bifunctional diguanylate cyclase/phosphodiesterase [Ilumatobacteraceae bacterium]
MTARLRRPAAALLVTASVAVSILFAWRTGTTPSPYPAVIVGVATVATLVVLWSVHRRRGTAKSDAWLAVAASCLITAAFSAVDLLGGSLDPGLARQFSAVLSAPDRTLLAVALWAMLAARSLTRNRYLAIEALVVSLAVGLGLSVYVLVPAIEASSLERLDRLLSLGLPASDLLLVALAARLALGLDARSKAMLLLLAGLLARLIANGVHYWEAMTGTASLPAMVLTALSLVLLAAASLAPDTAAAVTEPTIVKLDRVRLGAMMCCAIVPQIVVIDLLMRESPYRNLVVAASLVAMLVTCLAIAHLWVLAIDVRDLTEVRGADRLASLVDRSRDVVVVVDSFGRISYTSGAITHVLGYESDRWFRWSVYDLPVEPTGGSWSQVILQLRALEPDEHLDEIEVAATHANGRSLLMMLSAVNLNHNPAIAGIVLNLRDVTDTRELQHQLRFRADHDELTGLANRGQFLATLTDQLAGGRTPIVMFIDLDDFKSINDSLGHEAGDVLLRSVGARLSHRFPPELGLVARLGGDEFAVILRASSLAQAAEFAKDAMEDLRSPVLLNHFNSVSGSCSIGIARPEAGDNASALLRNADLAMYRAKRRGKGVIEVFDAHLEREVARTEEYRRDLLTALGRNQFNLVYQPILRMEDGVVVGAEALIRWNHHVYGPIQPTDFISIAEQTGVIIPIGWWSIRQACLTAATMPNDVFITVNVSGSQLRGASLVDHVRSALVESELDPHRLVLEITESTLIDDPDGVAEELVRLRQLGVRIALDDFGTGYSSLSYVQRLPLDIIKIDREFVQALDHPRDRALTRTIVAMANNLGLETIGEGIEDQRHAETLGVMGCTYVQGFLFSRPLEAAAMRRVLYEQRVGLDVAAAPMAPPSLASSSWGPPTPAHAT